MYYIYDYSQNVGMGSMSFSDSYALTTIYGPNGSGWFYIEYYKILLSLKYHNTTTVSNSSPGRLFLFINFFVYQDRVRSFF